MISSPFYGGVNQGQVGECTLGKVPPPGREGAGIWTQVCGLQAPHSQPHSPQRNPLYRTPWPIPCPLPRVPSALQKATRLSFQRHSSPESTEMAQMPQRGFHGIYTKSYTRIFNYRRSVLIINRSHYQGKHCLGVGIIIISRIHKERLQLNNNPMEKNGWRTRHFSKNIQMANKHMKRCL